MESEDEYISVPEDNSIDVSGDHSIESYDWIFDIPEDKKGYVAPRKDVIENSLGYYQMAILLLFFLGITCKNAKNQLNCLEERTKEIKDTKDYLIVQKALKDTLNSWVNLGIKDVQSLKRNNWKVDKDFLFNTKKDKVLLLLLEQDMSIDAKLDFIEILLGVKESREWKFYYKSMPSIVAIRARYGKKEAFTFEELSEMAKKEIIRGGYYNKWTCKINDGYVEGWYDKHIEEKHREFLKNR